MSINKWISIFLLFFALTFFACSNTKEPSLALVKENVIAEKVPPVEDPSLILKISPSHIKYFVDIENEEYRSNSVENIFQSFLEKSDPFCNMVWGKTKYDKKLIHQFIGKESFQEKPFSNMGHPVPKLISGCWNFYRMNDMDSVQDFRLVKHLFPKQPKDCYSVGFMQPYIMHNILNCNSVNMLDVDWRILYGHHQMVKKFKTNQFQSSDDLQETLKDMNIGWVARFDGKPIESKVNVDIHTFCYRNNYAMCKEMLLELQNNFSHSTPIQFHLSYLHEGKYEATHPDSMIVIYLSNAIDNVYTSFSEFKYMLSSVSKIITKDQSVLFVYHAGGRKNFGLYLLKNKEAEDGYNITVVCRDKYVTPPILKTVGTYSTYFEYITPGQSNAQTCEDMVYRMDKPKKILLDEPSAR